MERPLLIVVSAPSGAGKSTLCNRLVKERASVEYSISCTTRAPRGAEQDGEHYYFLSSKEFRQRVRRGEFLEHAKVHGNRYGTLADTVQFAMEDGRHIILDIDVQGVRQLRSSLQTMEERSLIRRGFLDIFIEPPSLEVLENRLRKRGTDSDAVIRKRLKNAAKEMQAAEEYTHRLVNDQLDPTYERLCQIIDASV
ncbi:MAG: guanylate kinase [Kiritimatiellaceae bacterium]|nr:MAG: guanylate kinase [Kiritimatiellaceae bacterium]